MNPAAFEHDAHDLIGIGFGPSNLALAIALEELSSRSGGSLKSLFIEKQANYRWHGDTLVNQSTLQISFLKDLVSLRNPTSPYSFVNYLHQQGRLVDFINMGTFYPCRMEFNDYLLWAAKNFSNQVHYGETALRIEPEYTGHTIDRLRLVTRDHKGIEKSYRSRGVVIGSGGTPKIPEIFLPFKTDVRVFHHSTYLSGTRQLPTQPDKPIRVAIVGGGQSAAEAFIDLNDKFPTSRVDIIFRGSALKPADDTPFVNEIFAPEYIDVVYGQNAVDRAQFIDEYHNTNYSVVDRDLIDQIYRILYRQKINDQHRHTMLCRRRIQSASASPADIRLTLTDIATGEHQTRAYDFIVLATGYERRSHHDLLDPLKDLLGDFRVDRNYRLITEPVLSAPIYLQGFCEPTHGLSDTLLSVLPNRAEEIGKALYQSLDQHAGRLQDQRSPSLVDALT